MGIQKPGANMGKTYWMQLDGKTGTLTSWDRAAQAEVEHGPVDGKVIDVRVKERSYGNKGTGFVVSVTLKDEAANERYVIETGAGSRVTTRLLGQLNAADLSQPVQVRPIFMKEGSQIGDQIVKMDTVSTVVRPVTGRSLSDEGDTILQLGDSIKPYYGEKYGNALPKAEPVLNAKGDQIMQNGQPLMDRTEIETLCKELVVKLNDRAQGRAPAMAPDAADHADFDGEIDADEVLEAAGAADREAMRARA